MKKITTVLFSLILLVTLLVGCKTKKGDNANPNSNVVNNPAVVVSNNSSSTVEKEYVVVEKGRVLYNTDLSSYVEVADYLSIAVDTTSSEYLNYYNAIVENDISKYDLCQYFYPEDSANANAVVKDGDIINLDYAGKVDGVAFDGGTASGYDLQIGSGKFIDGFEDALIGIKVGETKDITVVFPTDYHTDTLAGKEAVFTCKINKIARKNKPEESYQKMNFDSVQAYIDDITERAIKNYIYNEIIKNSTVNAYPKNDKTLLTTDIVNYMTSVYAEQGQSFETILQQYDMTVQEYGEKATENLMYENMILYSILDKENLEISQSVIDVQDQALPDSLAESYAVNDIVLEYIYQNIEIK